MQYSHPDSDNKLWTRGGSVPHELLTVPRWSMLDNYGQHQIPERMLMHPYVCVHSSRKQYALPQYFLYRYHNLIIAVWEVWLLLLQHSSMAVKIKSESYFSHIAMLGNVCVIFHVVNAVTLLSVFRNIKHRMILKQIRGRCYASLGTQCTQASVIAIEKQCALHVFFSGTTIWDLV